MKHQSLDDWQRKRIIELARAKVSTATIAARLGLAQSTVQQIVRENNG